MVVCPFPREFRVLVCQLRIDVLLGDASSIISFILGYEPSSFYHPRESSVVFSAIIVGLLRLCYYFFELMFTF